MAVKPRVLPPDVRARVPPDGRDRLLEDAVSVREPQPQPDAAAPRQEELPFAIVPLVMFTRDKAKMGALAAPGWLTAVAAVIAVIIISLNVKLLWDLALG